MIVVALICWDQSFLSNVMRFGAELNHVRISGENLLHLITDSTEICSEIPQYRNKIMHRCHYGVRKFSISSGRRSSPDIYLICSTAAFSIPGAPKDYWDVSRSPRRASRLCPNVALCLSQG